MAQAAVHSKMVVLLFLIHCLLLPPIFMGFCIVIQYLVSFLVLQSLLKGMRELITLL